MTVPRSPRRDEKMTEERLDEETEATIIAVDRRHPKGIPALRSRIRFLIEEARKSGEAEGARQVRQMVRLEMGLSDAR